MRLALAVGALTIAASICACALDQAHRDHECADRLGVPVETAHWDQDKGQCVTVASPLVAAAESTASAAAPGAGLGPESCAESQTPPPQLRSQPDYRQQIVTVSKAAGGYVAGLSKDDFRVLQGGSARTLDFFEAESNAPASIGILIDTSASMQPRIPQAGTVIAQFVRDLNDCDDLFLLAFSTHPILLQPFTTDHRLVIQGLEHLRAYGNTALFDSVLQATIAVQGGRYRRKILVVITDGMDNSSQARLNEVVAEAHRTAVLVYTIGIGEPNAESMPSISVGQFVIGSGVDAQSLKTLSEGTGAKSFIIASIGDGDSLKKALHAILEELPPQYIIGFTSTGSGQSTQIEVRNHERAAVSSISQILPVATAPAVPGVVP